MNQIEFYPINIKPPDPLVRSINGDDFQVIESFPVKLAYWLRQLQFEIPKGYVSDLASIPPIIRWKYDRVSLGFLAVLIHDYLCEFDGVYRNLGGNLIRIGALECHTIFLIMMLIDGIPASIAFECFIGVVLFGGKWKATDPITKKLRDRIDKSKYLKI